MTVTVTVMCQSVRKRMLKKFFIEKLEYIVNASNMLSDNEGLAFVFVGEGIEKEKLKLMSKNKNFFVITRKKIYIIFCHACTN